MVWSSASTKRKLLHTIYMILPMKIYIIIGWRDLQIYYTWIFYHLYRRIHILFHNSRYSIISIFHLFDHIAIRNYNLFLLEIVLEYLAHRKIFELVYFLFESPNMAYHPNCSLRFYIAFLKNKIIEPLFSISIVFKSFSFLYLWAESK